MVDTTIPWLLIGGTGRCGTTMLRQVLQHHPELYVIPEETNVHPSHFGEWFARAYRPHAQAAGKQAARYVVEKTPSNSLYAHRLLHRELVGSRYLHIIRHRPAVIASMAARPVYTLGGWGLPHDEHEIGLVYDAVNQMGVNLVERLELDGRGLLVVYDAVLRDPAGQLGRICEWLGISPPPDLMTDPRGFMAEKATWPPDLGRVRIGADPGCDLPTA